MKKLAYTGITQMTNLFLETVLSRMGNSTVNDSFKVFVPDWNTAIQRKEEEVLAVVRDAITEYFNSLVKDEDYVAFYVRALNQELNRLELVENDLIAPFFEETLKSIIK